MFYCTPKSTVTALPVIHASFLEVEVHRIGKAEKEVRQRSRTSTEAGKQKQKGREAEQQKSRESRKA